MPPSPAEPKRVILVDDEPHQRIILAELLSDLGYEATVCETGIQVLEKLRFSNFDVLLTDMQMPGMDGLQLVEAAHRVDPSVSVILCTAHGTIETAIQAMKKGAEDYLLKPIEGEALDLLLKKTFEKRALIKQNKQLFSENEALKRDIGIKYHLSQALGRSEAAQKLMEQVKHYVKIREAILILGEPGTGTAEVAKMIHYNSPWAYNQLIFFDCGAVPEELQEIHLFGEALTVRDGVKSQGHAGLVESAHLGTLVLSNVHRLNKPCQARISRVMKEEKTQRVGSQVAYHVFTRIIATSSESEFSKFTQQNDFRWDVHDLLKRNCIVLPALRNRREDIPILIAAAAKKAGQEIGKEIQKIDKPVVDALMKYDFPGNQQELESLVQTAVIRAQDSVLTLRDFPHLAASVAEEKS